MKKSVLIYDHTNIDDGSEESLIFTYPIIIEIEGINQEELDFYITKEYTNFIKEIEHLQDEDEEVYTEALNGFFELEMIKGILDDCPQITNYEVKTKIMATVIRKYMYDIVTSDQLEESSI